MYITVKNSETLQPIKIISEEELFDMCGKDKRMYDDYIRHLKNHPYVKPLHEIWKIIE